MRTRPRRPRQRGAARIEQHEVGALSRLDAADHAGNYRVLPVLVRVSWQGRTGPRSIRLLTTIADL